MMSTGHATCLNRRDRSLQQHLNYQRIPVGMRINDGDERSYFFKQATCPVDITQLSPCNSISRKHVGEGHLFATLPDLRPPPLQGKWWGTKVQITFQKVGHIRFVRSNPFPSSHVSGGWNQAMEKEKCIFLM